MAEIIIDTAIKYWTQELFVIIIALFGVLWRQMKNLYKQVNALVGGVRGNLRMQIKAEAKIHLGNGYITLHDRKVLDELFEEYFALGGNGPVKLLKREIDSLPTRIEANKNAET